MSYEIKPLRGKVGLSTDVDPLVFETGLQVAEMGLLHFIFTVDAVSAGINPGNPATFDCEHSWDGGVTWTDIPNMITEDVNAAGVYRAYVSNATGLIAPNVRVMLLCPAGEEVVIGRAERIHVSPRDSVFLAPPAIAGGIASEATLQDILADTTALLGLDYATETTLASVLLGIGLIAAKDFATETTLASVLLDTAALAAKDFATQTTLSTRATEATQLLIKAKTDNLDVALSTRATEATQLLVKAKTDNLDVALSTRATEATAQKLREWPYATYDKQKLTQGVLTDTWEYIDGVTVVGTILITYTDATKNTIDNVAYSPDQVV